jgi:hypothetical protein
MFKRRTLFILGAGSSAEAGLPVGNKPAKMIAELLAVGTSRENAAGEALLGRLYERRPLPNRGYHQAAQRIRNGLRQSRHASLGRWITPQGASCRGGPRRDLPRGLKS